MLSVLTSGPVDCDSTELLSPERVDPILLELGKRFDHIIIDSPPVLAVADAGVLANIADGVVLVIAAEETPRQAINYARRMLELAGARVIGVVLNKVNVRHGQYYGYYAQQDRYGNSFGSAI
jgi:capsular exopolysaccharide synthesis family protein